jgi:hypothetical protein
MVGGISLHGAEQPGHMDRPQAKSGYLLPPTRPKPLMGGSFFVIKHGEEDWLVLAQDKINATSFADAVKKLNFAVDLIKQKIPKMKVFCIANVIVASDQTWKQHEFTCPYLLVRDHEINDFYTVHFGPAFSFLRTSWRKSFEAQQLQVVLPQPSKKAKP